MNIDVTHELSHTANQFLTFTLDNQDFAIDILQVQEIRNFTTITPIPNSPTEVMGVINLRGTVVPVIDLRTALSFEPAKDFKFAVIIVANIDTHVVGLVVDAVSDVIDLDAGDVEPPPAFVSQKEPQIVRGIAKSDDRLISILSVSQFVQPNVETELETLVNA